MKVLQRFSIMGSAAALFLVLGGAQAATFQTVGIGKVAPNFTATDVNGQVQSIKQYRGKIIVLDWADPDCSYDGKHYRSGNIPAMQTEAKNNGIIWLTVNSAYPGKMGYDYGGTKLTDWMKAVKWDGTSYIRDPNGIVGHIYHATATPEFYIIDKDGTLKYAGAIDNIPSQDPADIPKATNYVKKALAEVMAGKPVSTPVTRAYGCTVKYEGES